MGIRHAKVSSIPDSDDSSLIRPSDWNAEHSLPRGHFYGLGTARNGTSDIDIQSGECRDGADSDNMVLPTTITKLEAAWAAGNNAGGLDTGSAYSNSTWYYVWLIKNPTSGVVDALLSASKTAPTMPSGYTVKKLIWAVYSNSGGTLDAWTQSGDYGHWTDGILDLDTTAPAVVWTAIALRVPAISGVVAFGQATVRNTLPATTTGHQLGLNSGNVPDPSSRFQGDIDIPNYHNSGTLPQTQVQFYLQVNASSQIKYQADSATNIRILIRTKGFILDRRSL